MRVRERVQWGEPATPRAEGGGITPPLWPELVPGCGHGHRVYRSRVGGAGRSQDLLLTHGPLRQPSPLRTFTKPGGPLPSTEARALQSV